MGKLKDLKFTKLLKRDLFLYLSFFYISYLTALGAWWLFTFIKLQSFLPKDRSLKMMNMLKWEGATFLVILILLSISLLILYIRDRKKTKGMQSFYAGMTHELKTPLASMRLQAEVIENLAANKNIDLEKIQTYSNRLIEDSKKLEDQMDKILQLGRIEGGGNLNMENIDLNKFVEDILNKWNSDLEIKVTGDKDLIVSADYYALELIIRNLIENTSRHCSEKSVTLNLSKLGSEIEIEYQDNGHFSGNKEKLGRLFYKHESSKGSGIGLYLCERLAKMMGGAFSVEAKEKWKVTFILQQGLSS
tara:strand:- start:148147 stop:149058 length:912 start_codon:yes stop_codon:yes gene_type:complete